MDVATLTMCLVGILFGWVTIVSIALFKTRLDVVYIKKDIANKETIDGR